MRNIVKNYKEEWRKHTVSLCLGLFVLCYSIRFLVEEGKAFNYFGFPFCILRGTPNKKIISKGKPLIYFL
jgi:hypothetical protein